MYFLSEEYDFLSTKKKKKNKKKKLKKKKIINIKKMFTLEDAKPCPRR